MIEFRAESAIVTTHAGRQHRYPEAQRKQQGVEQPIQLIAEAAASPHDDLVVQALGFQDDGNRQSNIQIFEWNVMKMIAVQATERFKRKQYKEARLALHELVALRRYPDDWILLGSCESALRNQASAVEALLMAVRINPRLWRLQQQLAELTPRATHVEVIDSIHGHDGFIIETEALGKIIARALG